MAFFKWSGGLYSPNFEEHSRDDISLLLEMSEQEIETCIPKAGHRARFRKALRTLRFRTDPVASHDVHVAIPPDAATLSDEQVSQNSKTHVADSFVSAMSHCSTPMVLSSGRAVTIVTSSLDGPQCMIKEWDPRGASGDTGSPVINNTKSRVDKFTITSRYTEPPLGNEGKANTEDICQNRRGENEEDTDVTTVIDENNTFLSSDMLDVIQANAV